jgi:hypothetical protein
LTGAGVQPDCIAIGTVTNTACITAGSINYTNNTLTLATPLTWSSGANVWLYKKSDGVVVLTGSAPDMGALPFASSCTPAQLAFTFQPTGVELGQTIPRIDVTVQDAGGNKCGSATNSITLVKDGAATWGTLNFSGNDATKAATSGVASWTSDLFVTGSTGSGSIDATSSGLTSATSNSITISCTPAKLIWTAQPVNIGLGATLPTVQVSIENAFNFVCTSATNSITLSRDASATWSALTASGNDLTQAAVAGVASWSDLSITPQPGTGSMDANATGLTGAVSNSITLTEHGPGQHFRRGGR